MSGWSCDLVLYLVVLEIRISYVFKIRWSQTSQMVRLQ
jgi:hypothetical protein